MEDREQIRRAYYLEKKSTRQIAKEQRRSRKTVRKVIESAEAEYTISKASVFRVGKVNTCPLKRTSGGPSR